MKINEGHPNETKQGLLIQGLLSQGHQLPSLTLRETQTGRGVEKLSGRKRGRLWLCPDWRLLACSDCRQANKKWAIVYDWLREHIWLSPVGPESEAGAKSREADSY